MNWQPVYGLLILFSTLVTYLCGRGIQQHTPPHKKKIILLSSLLINLGILFVFKYANFISSSFNDLFTTLHIKMEVPLLDILLPVGISFYTFQAIGYTIDVYRGDIPAEKNFITYALFVSFFPQLVAGPIERAKNLLPQFHRPHIFDAVKAVEGFRLILWGYFMKVVISDRLAVYVDSVYNNISHHTSITLVLATVFFAFQIYCDFGGYSNIAIGCAKVMGFDLMTNFRRPYLATSVADFWRRWHISLSTWFKDYVYIPLGGNRCRKSRNYLNLFITFVVSGVWHGANWTFVVWGALNGFFQIIGKITGNIYEKLFAGKRFRLSPKISHGWNVITTFILILVTWVFFRANSVADAFCVFDRIMFSHGRLFTNNIDSLIYGIFFILFLVTIEILQEKHEGRNLLLENKRAVVRYVSYLGLILLIIMLGVLDSSQFIYFQF
ncbi:MULTISPECIES: MBOAT family O-acyltransferase [unclassified Parabacteroides]|uniref:MBOAT family O-acyltransferase n=1 Tax=unclassified Parabacteroides TaxID=2649774 RepID=UPI0024753B85|nr:MULTISPECIES: MBOAT family O-acyltransferase [unclassified Parabacteroides]